MKGAVLYGPKDIRFEHRDDPKIIQGAQPVTGSAPSTVTVSPG